MNNRQKLRLKFSLVIVLAVVAGFVAYPQAASKVPRLFDLLNKPKINLGLDLQGGIHLEYKADTSQVDGAKTAEAMQAVQDVIERRVNAFGVAEPVVYTTKSGGEQRLVVELAGVKDINEAKKMISETPFLEFKEEKQTEAEKIPEELINSSNEKSKAKAEEVLKKVLTGEDFAQLAKDNSQDPGSKDNGGEYDFQKKGDFVAEYEDVIFNKDLKDGEIYPNLVETSFGWHIIKRIEVRGEGDDQEFKSAHILFSKMTQPQPKTEFVSTGLSGKHLKNAKVDLEGQSLEGPRVSLKFDEEGTGLFAEITKRNVGKGVAIYLDNLPISDTNGDGKIDKYDPPYAPRIQEEILTGEAVITGSYTIEEAKALVKRLNEGALPVPLSIISEQSVEATLGQVSLEKSLKAGIIGLLLVIIFMLLYYRFLGLIASFSLLIYSALMISIFKLSGLTDWQITLTLPGIAGFVLSIGMAVDANILIFERTKEEVRKGRNILSAIEEGFKRAWTSILDGNMSSIITALILVEMGTGFVKGFAVTLIIGVLASMFTAVVITRTILRFILGSWIENKMWLIGAKKQERVE
jgi:protein-export membrane protein SecD